MMAANDVIGGTRDIIPITTLNTLADFGHNVLRRRVADWVYGTLCWA